MGHFKPAYLWWERSNGHKVAKFRWESFYPDGNAWWVPEDYPARSSAPDYATKAEREMCPVCGKIHPYIFNEGFVCVNEACVNFWTLRGEKLTDKTELTYNPVWLAERTEWPAIIVPPFSLTPKSPEVNDANDLTYSTMRAAYKGIVCPQCHCCVSRKKMDGYYCETPDCGYVRQPPSPILNIRTIEQAHGSQWFGHPIPRHLVRDPVERRGSTWDHSWRIETFDVVDGCLVKQFHSNEVINARTGGANDMLARMWNADLKLERRLMKQSIGECIPVIGIVDTNVYQVDGQLTDHFSGNFVS